MLSEGRSKVIRISQRVSQKPNVSSTTRSDTLCSGESLPQVFRKAIVDGQFMNSTVLLTPAAITATPLDCAPFTIQWACLLRQLFAVTTKHKIVTLSLRRSSILQTFPSLSFFRLLGFLLLRLVLGLDYVIAQVG